MIITCHMCDKNIYVPVTREEFNHYKEKGLTAQEAFPHLSASDREMLISQHCQKCWDFLFKDA